MTRKPTGQRKNATPPRAWDAFAVVDKRSNIIDFDGPDGTPIFTDKGIADALCDPGCEEVIRVIITEARKGGAE
jgi:hypothetical protein